MVQREVKKKASAYGLMAVLLASMCVALIYGLGSTPGVAPLPSISPSVSSSPSSSPSLPFPSASSSPFPSPSSTTSPNPSNPPINEVSPMKTFGSYSELKDFLTTNGQTNGGQFYVGSRDLWTQSVQPVPSAAPSALSPSLATESGKGYSTTNVQVAGVDEADTVKTDGNYLYLIANNTIFIMNADPQVAKVLSKIKYENTYLSGIYLSQDGNKLAVIGSQYIPYIYPADARNLGIAIPDIYPYSNSQSTFVYVYDVSNKNSPLLARNFTMSGNYLNSRMIGNYVYTIVTQGAYVVNDTAVLPMLYYEKTASLIAPTSVYYTGVSDSYYSYTTFVAMNILDSVQAPTNMTIMMGGAGEIYVSTTNIYVTYPVYEYSLIATETARPTATIAPTPSKAGSDNSSSSAITITPTMPIWRGPSTSKTAIYRVKISGSSMTFAAQGNVTGTVLDQYSMDEYNDYFRIITTAYIYNDATYMSTQQNNVYVLDMSLKTVGKVENIATGENFHSSRFMGSRVYMVTFMKTDPLFVIDLSQPTSPRVLGNLTIPGYSDYLHPYDETHLIGLGKDTVASDQGDFAWYQGLKLSLFDVSDVNHPSEVAKIIIGDRGTNSEALSDPHAFLFDRTRNLLVIPVDLYLLNVTQPTATPSDRAILPILPWNSGPSAYGTLVWQGVYVFKVTLDGGFQTIGTVTQLSNQQLVNLVQGYYYTKDGSYDNGYNYWITRSLYIGNVLYTISNARVQLNSLDKLALIAQVELN